MLYFSHRSHCKPLPYTITIVWLIATATKIAILKKKHSQLLGCLTVKMSLACRDHGRFIFLLLFHLVFWGYFIHCFLRAPLDISIKPLGSNTCTLAATLASNFNKPTYLNPNSTSLKII